MTAHREAACAARDAFADAAESDDAERLGAQLRPDERLPAAFDDAAVRVNDVARDGQQQREDVIGDGVLVRARRDRDQHVAVARGVEVDALETDAAA